MDVPRHKKTLQEEAIQEKWERLFALMDGAITDKPALLSRDVPEVLPYKEGQHIVVETVAEAYLSRLVGDALMTLQKELDALEPPFTDEEDGCPAIDAIFLVKKYGSLRKAERATGYAKSTLHKIMKQQKAVAA